jgi:hypothetical protein
MGYKNSFRFRGDAKDVPRSLEIYAWLPTSKANDYLVVEIGAS